MKFYKINKIKNKWVEYLFLEIKWIKINIKRVERGY